MPFDAELARRVRSLLDVRPGFEEKAMFGGRGFMCRGNLAVGVWNDWLLLRLGPRSADKALQLAGFKVFDITGRPMRGWVMADLQAVADDHVLRPWVERAWRFAAKLGPK
jgi:TfoX/Sxy family transcriptional regulator of competence genes